MLSEGNLARDCPFCGHPPVNARSKLILGQFMYWCSNQQCRLGKAKIKFWFSEWNSS